MASSYFKRGSSTGLNDFNDQKHIPAQWNNLPTNLKLNSCEHGFKVALKRYLLNAKAARN